MANATNTKSYEIFFSCESKNEQLCMKLCNKLTTELGLKIWMRYINAKKVEKIIPLIKSSISLSQIFVCAISVKYTETKECIDEIILANERGLSGVIILLEPTMPHNFPGLSFTKNWPKIKMYEDLEDLSKWTGPNYDLLIEKIMETLNRAYDKPGGDRSELDEIFHEMQSSLDKFYEKNWDKLEATEFKDDVTFSMEILPNGVINIGHFKNDKFIPIPNHIGNWTLLKLKANNNDNFKKFNSLINFCFQHLGKNAVDSLNKKIDGYFKVTHANPVGVELLDSLQKCSLNDILNRYFKFIAYGVWNQLSVKAQKVMISCPADYGLLEKGDLKLYLDNAGLDILQIVSMPISEALALFEKNRKLGKKGDQGQNKYILIDWKTGALSVTAFETIPNKPLQLLNSFNDSNLTSRMLEKQQFLFIKGKLKNSNEIELTNELVEKALVDSFEQFQSGSDVAKVKLTDSVEIQITFKEMVKLCSAYVEKSSKLLMAILHERKMKLTDFKRVYYCCALPYKTVAVFLYEEMFKDIKLEENFFTFEQDLETLQSISQMADKKIRSNFDSVVIPLDFNFGLRNYGGLFDIVLERGLALPALAKTEYTTARDNQNAIALRIYSGERPLCRHCDFLGQLVIPNLPKKLAGEVSIEVTFKINESGILTVDAKEISQNTYFKTSIDRSNMKIQKKTAIIEAQLNETEDSELANQVKYATEKIARLQIRYRDDENVLLKVDGFIDIIVKHSETMTIDTIKRIIKEIDQY